MLLDTASYTKSIFQVRRYILLRKEKSCRFIIRIASSKHKGIATRTTKPLRHTDSREWTTVQAVITTSRAATSQIWQNENSYMGTRIIYLAASCFRQASFTKIKISEELGLRHGYKNKRRRVGRSCIEPKRINHIASILPG